MAEFSQFWDTTGTGDGLVGGYTENDWIEFYQTLFIPELTTTAGVLPRSGNKLLVTGTNNANISVATGRAIIYGFLYKNTAALAVAALSVPVVGTTGFRIVLRASWAAQTVRVAAVVSADGVAAIPALTQSAGTTWEISLATGTITTGNVVTLTDTRAYAKYNTVIDGSHLEASIVDNSTLELVANVLRVKDSGITAAKLAAAIAGNGLAGGAGTALSVNVDNSSIEINADTLRVKALGIALSMLAADSVDDTKAGNRVAQVIRRYGGDANDWSVVGNTARTPTMVRIQAGVALSTGTTVTVPFAVNYSQVPMAICCEIGGGANAHICAVVSTSISNIVLEARNHLNAVTAGVNIAWLAIGTE